MFFKKLFFSSLVLFLLFELPGYSSSLEPESYIEVKIHNIGQGNCVTAKLYDHEIDTINYLLIDAGSSSYKKELVYQAYFKEKAALVSKKSQKKKKDRNKKTFDETPKRGIVSKRRELFESPDYSSLASPSMLLSTKRDVSPPTKKFSKKVKEKIKKLDKIEDKKIEEIRIALGQETKNSFVKVITVFVSHPDRDHYNWLPKIFNLIKYREDSIENIILGGIPSAYNQSLRKWLLSWVNRTSIYFPAVICDQPMTENALKQVWDPSFKPQWAPQYFSNVEGVITGNHDHLVGFEKAFPFTKNIKTYLLTANATHIEEKNFDDIIRMCDEDKSNSESLVIKLKNNNYSIDILGDATKLTTTRIIRNYSNSNFLSGTILTIAAHHGSYTHNCSDEEWIKKTLPSYVIFSCGMLHNHPALEVYERFKNHSNLGITNEHQVWVWEKNTGQVQGENEKSRKSFVHMTSRGIYSTFCSGTLNFILSQKKFSLRSEMNDYTEFDLSDGFNNLKEREKSQIADEVFKTLEITPKDISTIEKTINIQLIDQQPQELSDDLSIDFSSNKWLVDEDEEISILRPGFQIGSEDERSSLTSTETDSEEN